MFLSRSVRTGLKVVSSQLRRNVTLSKMRMSNFSNDQESPNDKPVKYSTSQAAKWKAEYSRKGTDSDDDPWFEMYFIIGSIAVFLCYFCILREENDIDEMLGKSLYERIDGLEEYQLKVSLAHNKRIGKDITAIENRLQEIDRAKLHS